MWSISTNILTVLANFLGIHNSVLLKNIGHDRGNTIYQPTPKTTRHVSREGDQYEEVSQ
jgi:hypothetical protein